MNLIHQPIPDPETLKLCANPAQNTSYSPTSAGTVPTDYPRKTSRNSTYLRGLSPQIPPLSPLWLRLLEILVTFLELRFSCASELLDFVLDKLGAVLEPARQVGMVDKAVKLRLENGFFVLFRHFGRIEHGEAEFVEASLLAGLVRRRGIVPHTHEIKASCAEDEVGHAWVVGEPHI